MKTATRSTLTVSYWKISQCSKLEGYTLLRLTENSHHMVEIEGPDSGITVPFLKDVVNQAKLYIRPLQRDITKEDMKKYSIRRVRLSACIKHEYV